LNAALRGDPAILEARNVSRRRGDGEGWLLHDVSAIVRPGDRVALLGSSGAGKTVLLRTLARLDPLDEGTIFWRGEPTRGEAVPAFRGEVVYVHQRPALFEGDVEANLRVPFTLRTHAGRRFDRERTVVLLESLGRDASFLKKSHRDLSGGEAQIAALIRAVQLDPAILFLDEPTASLDRESSRAIEALLDGWYSQAPSSRAFVWVTHDHDQADRATRLRWSMQSGRLRTEE
jgi:putative ABC transport system ATP-binding protein